MFSLRRKRNNCGPPCSMCYAPVLCHKIVTKNMIFHAKCFPCFLCGDNSGNRYENMMYSNGYHRLCQPCCGCGKPFQHIRDHAKYCTKRCETYAPVMDVVYVSSMRSRQTLPKVLLVMIYEFVYSEKPPKIQYFLSEYTRDLIAETERKHQLRLM